MESTQGMHSMGFVLGVLVGLVLIGVVLWATGRRYQGGRQYDERQKLAQGKAYKTAFFTMIAYFAAGGMFDLMTGIRWCDLFTFASIGLLLSVWVFAVVCIRLDAYIPFSQNAMRTVWITGAIGLINLIIGVMNLTIPGYMIVDGMLTYHCVNLLCGIILVGLSLATLIKARRANKGDAS